MCVCAFLDVLGYVHSGSFSDWTFILWILDLFLLLTCFDDRMIEQAGNQVCSQVPQDDD